MTDTLRWLDGDVRDRAEVELLAAARSQDARTFGRACRRLLAEVDTDAAHRPQGRRHLRRGVRLAETPDGMTVLSGQFAGLDAETVQTAIHSFRRPDAPGQRRTAEQATADALVDICQFALDAGAAPANRSVRPHILVTVDEPTLADRDGSGVCEAAWTGPLPWPEARRLLADASVSRVLLDPAGAPTGAGVAVRTVSAGRLAGHLDRQPPHRPPPRPATPRRPRPLTHHRPPAATAGTALMSAQPSEPRR